MTAVEVGWLRCTAGVEGDYLVALDAESMEDAYAACPGVPLYRPRELAEMRKLDAVGVAFVARVKRWAAEGSRWGAVVEAVIEHPADAESQPVAA